LAHLGTTFASYLWDRNTEVLMSTSKFKARALNEQVIVIMDATGGIGRMTAKMAASKGAKVVLAAINRDDIDDVVDEINASGGKAMAVTADVSKIQDVINLKNKALQKFERIDTWINNAGSSHYGYLLEADLDEEKKLFDINFWSTRYGSQVGVLAMEKEGGVLINLGIEISVSAQPLLGMYAASKQALKAFTDCLRSELRDKDIHVEVCLVRPSAIDTELDTEPTAEAIIKCAEEPQRDVYVGGPARLTAILDTFFPQVKDMMTETKMKELKNEGSGSVFKALKNNLKSSLKDMRKPDGH
jgi:short-subunit dehydrogenase